DDDALDLELPKEPSALPPSLDSEVQASADPFSDPFTDPALEITGREEDPASGLFEREPSPAFGLPLVHPEAPEANQNAPLQVAGKSSQLLPAQSASAPTVRPGNKLRKQRRPEDDPVVELDSAATSPHDEALGDLRDRYAIGDFSGALAVAESILQAEPGHGTAERFADNCRKVLEQMYVGRLGSLGLSPRVAVESDRLRWLSLDHRAGFLLSLVDGGSTVEELLDISGMPRYEALRILCELLEQNVIVLSQS
ncbi:MAG TPA: hypothetical protein VGP93_03805, partial [Polyangiaceae bacterium]|nr:hypothetical protein [Polyangiaceae bacterium]